MPARYSIIAANGPVFSQCYATASGKPSIGPPFSFARVTVSDDGQTDLAEYLEVTGDKRSRWDGWDWAYNGSPTRVNDWPDFTLVSGVVYVLDAHTKSIDGRALLAVNDLGPAG